MNKSYIKSYLFLLATLICTTSTNQLSATTDVATEISTPETNDTKQVEQHVDEIAIIFVNDSANPTTIKDKIIALYEKIKQVIQDFRSKPAQDPKKLRQALELEILKLLVQGKITSAEIRCLRDNQALLTKLSDKSTIILIESIGNLSQAHQAQAESNTLEQTASTQKVGATKITQEIIQHFAHIIAEISKIISHENKALVDKVSTHIGHLRTDFERAFQKSLLQCFTEQELNELRTFVKSPAFKKLLTNVPLLKEIFFKNLSPEIISKLKSLI